MTPEMFSQLTSNIANAETLESVPLLAETERGLEIVSGHHRIRAAIQAGVKSGLALVYSGLSSSQIRGKQLAHNSITGQDDPEILRRIYEQITEVQAQMEAFVDPKVFEAIPDAVSFTQADIDPLGELKYVTFAFLPVQKSDFDDTMLVMIADSDEVYVAHRDAFDDFKVALQRVRRECNVRSAPTAIAEMCRLASKALDIMSSEEEDASERNEAVECGEAVG